MHNDVKNLNVKMVLCRLQGDFGKISGWRESEGKVKDKKVIVGGCLGNCRGNC